MEIKATIETFKSGAFVDCDGLICKVADFPNARMEQESTYTSVQLCDKEGGVDYEYVWYPSVQVIEDIISSSL